MTTDAVPPVGRADEARPAYLADGRAIDRDAFYAVACDPQRSAVVEACAGAGKTWILVSRMLRALLDGAEPQQILAITFTRKAAGEMRDRLDQWLRDFAAPAMPHAARVQALVERGLAPARAEALAPALQQLHARVLRSGRAVEVHTFHAWFSQLLRAAPREVLAELRLQPDVALVEDVQVHAADLFRRFHAALLERPALLADHAALVAQRGRHTARRWLEAAWSRRVEFELADAAGVLEGGVPLPAERWPALRGLDHPADALRQAAWRERLQDLASALGRGGARSRDAAVGVAAALEAAEAVPAFQALWSALFTQGAKPRRLCAVADAAGVAALQDALAEVAQQTAQHDAAVEHRRLVRLARLLLAEWDAFKREGGLADMDDLERCGLALLGDATLSAFVQERLDARIRHVLIDEFQDTSPLQWHALAAWWSGYVGAGGGESGQRPPGIFIVGDPKQSIYRFRRAEPRVFAAAAEFVAGPLGGVVLACDHTRRNAPAVTAALDTVFGAAQAAAEFDGFRPHTTEHGGAAGSGVFCLAPVRRPLAALPAIAAAAIASRRIDVDATAPATPAAPGWRDTLNTPRREPETVLREQEAARVAAAVRDLVDDGVAPADIFVLARRRQSLRYAAAALRRVHVPYAAADDFELMTAVESRDLVATLDALVSPQHRLSLAQALRSPLFGASDDDLIALAQRADGGDWWPALVGADHAGRPALQRAAQLLPRWQAAAQQLPPHDVLDRIVAEGELHERVAATVPPEQRVAALGAIDAVLEVALTLGGARYATPYAFVRALRRQPIRVTAPSQPDAVQLLTIHGAKGLEARVVFVMDADPEPQSAETACLLVDWPVDSARPRLCAFVHAESRCPPSLQPMLDAEMAARRREELNALYVAMSRAKERLVFSATEPHRSSPGRSWWQRIQPVAVAAEADAGGSLADMAAPLPASASSPPMSSSAPASVQLALDFAPAAPPAVVKALPRLPVPEPSSPASRQAFVDAAAGRSVDPPARESRPGAVGDDAATEASRLGEAVHRVLEWASGGTATAAAPTALDALAEAAAADYDVPVAAVAALAGRILASPACAPFFDRAACRWVGNEVTVADGDDLLRIDRLVLLAAPAPTWWVLDYKLNHAPERLAEHRDQLLLYRSAVQRLHPAVPVRCAFVTGAGAVVQIDP